MESDAVQIGRLDYIRRKLLQTTEIGKTPPRACSECKSHSTNLFQGTANLPPPNGGFDLRIGSQDLTVSVWATKQSTNFIDRNIKSVTIKNMKLCTECNKNEAEHESRSGDEALCYKCADKLDRWWDSDSSEYVDSWQECPDCGGRMEWCSCCRVYTQTCCVDYGTCLCS